MKLITVNHNTNTIAILDKWLVISEDTIVATFGSRQQARDSKLGKVFLASDVNINVIDPTADVVVSRVRKSTVLKATKTAYDLVHSLYGKMKPKAIFEEAQKQGIAYLTVRTMYQRYREDNNLTSKR